MKIVAVVVFIIVITSSIAVIIADAIYTHYQIEYNKILEKQNNILMENVKVYNRVLNAYQEALAEQEDKK